MLTRLQARRRRAHTTISADLGERIIWDLDRYDHRANDADNSGLVVALKLPGPGTFTENMENCSGQLVQLGQTLPVEGIPPAGQITQSVHPT